MENKFVYKGESSEKFEKVSDKQIISLVRHIKQYLLQ